MKKHLKDIFERVGVANRTELAVSIAKHSHSDGFPPGVSRHEGLVVTKSAR